jgi:hypothetical protein
MIAATAEGAVEISVTDGSTQQPVALARILLSGPQGGRIAYSDAEGKIVLEDLSSGDYRLSVYAAGFAIEQASLSVYPGQTSIAAIKLSRLGQPKIIASITVTARPSTSVSRVSASSPLTVTQGGLSAALSRLPGIHAENGALAIDGFTANSTPTAIDGLPISGAGSSAALSAVGLDLFQTVAVRSGGTANGPGVDLTTSDPTIAFSAESLWTADSRGGTAGQFTMRGTAGYVGYVFRRVQRTQAGVLDGMYYADESGLLYGHEDFTHGNGWLAKLRVPFGTSQAVLFESSAVDSANHSACNVASGGVPCGFGPGNYSSSSFHDSLARYEATSGRTTFSLGFADSKNYNAQNYLGRVINNSPAPLFSSGLVRGTSAIVHIEGPVNTSNDLSLDVTDFNQIFFPTIPAAPVPGIRNRFSSFGLTDQITSKSAIQTYASLTFSTARSSHISGRLGGVAHLGARDSLSGRLSIGESTQPALPLFPALGSINDPSSDSYDCLHHHVFAVGNSDRPDDPTDTGASLEYRHESGSSAFTLSASSDIFSNAFVATLAPGSLNGANAISPSALQNIEAFYATPGGCGTVLTLFPQDIILNIDRNAMLAVGRLTASYARSLRPGFIVAPYLQLTDSRYDAGAGKAQTPFVPRIRAGLLADYVFDRQRSEALAYVDYAGRNNASGTAPYAIVSLGITRKLQHGTATLSITNSTGTYGQSFASSAFAAPLPNGVIPIAQPFGRPSLRFSYDVTSGASGPAQRVSAVEALASIAQPASDVFVLNMAAIPNEPPLHPFEPDITASSCTPELVGKAKAVLDELAALASASERTPVNQPIVTDPGLGVSIVEHARDGFVSFALTPQNSLTGRALRACLTLHFDTVSDARNRHLYVPDSLPPTGTALFFDARVGAYTLFQDISRHLGADTSSQSKSSIALDAPPPIAPREPFAIKTSCPKGLQPFAEAVLTDLSRDVPLLLSGKNVTNSRFYQLHKQRGSLADWISISFYDPTAQSTILQCAHVVGATNARITAVGIGAIPLQLNFASAFGLYEQLP